MAVSQGFFVPAPFLETPDGELISVSVSTAPRSLESLLDCLAGLPFSINPQIFHGVPTVVEFPAYERQLAQVRSALQAYGFGDATVRVRNMLERISAA
jgi:hypothetical protein